ncbi:MAG: hypothetical protein U0996_04010 [Planctomycetaceae bacterium]
MRTCRSAGHPRTQRHRRGVLTLWTAIAVFFLCLLVTGVIQIIYQSGVQSQARHCAESAALAAGHAYLSDDLLRWRQQSFESEARRIRSTDAAVKIAGHYHRTSVAPELTSSHVQFDTQTSGNTGSKSGHVPSWIRAGWHSDPKNSSTPFWGPIVNSSLNVAATVSMEHSPCGFRIPQNAALPFLPFAICDDSAQENPVSGSTSGTGYWTEQIENGKGADQFSWNETSQTFELGPDGIPEISVALTSTSTTPAPDTFIPLQLHARNVGQAYSVAQQIETGLRQSDLESLGMQELRYPSAIASCTLAGTQVAQVINSLHRKAGKPCILSLCTTGIKSDSTTSLDKVTLKRPVAVRIIQTLKSTAGTTRVTLQPCVFVTSTAITSTQPQFANNRYIYSVRLID